MAIFDGDFTHTLDVFINSATQAHGYFVPWMLSNTIGDANDIKGAGGDALLVRIRHDATNPLIDLIYINSGNESSSHSYICSDDTLYSLEIERDVDAGANGEVYCRVHEGVTLKSTLTWVLPVDWDFDLIYAGASWDTNNNGFEFTGYGQKLDMGQSAGEEDFTTADWNSGVPQMDEDSDLTITASKVDVAGLDLDDTAYFYRDMSAAPPAGQPTMKRWGGVPHMEPKGRGVW